MHHSRSLTIGVILSVFSAGCALSSAPGGVLQFDNTDYDGLYAVRDDSQQDPVCQRTEIYAPPQTRVPECGDSVDLSAGEYGFQIGAFGTEARLIVSEGGTICTRWGTDTECSVRYDTPITIEDNVLRFNTTWIEIKTRFGAERSSDLDAEILCTGMRLPISHKYQLRMSEGGLGNFVLHVDSIEHDNRVSVTDTGNVMPCGR